MENTNDIYDTDDILDMDDLFEDGYVGGYSFLEFKQNHPTYLDRLNNHIMLLYNTYILVHGRRVNKIKKYPDCIEVASKCGFGMLMRHAMETIATSLATENGVEVGGRSVYERLTVLKGQNIPGYDRSKIDVLSGLLDLTNEIAHPHVLSKKSVTFENLCFFYEDFFKAVLAYHIDYIADIMEKSRVNDFGITKEISGNRKKAHKYLCNLKNQLDNFNIFSPSTRILTMGCLIRQLTECSANLWAYNYGVVPTDVSTAQNQISLGGVLNSLVHISRSDKSSAFGVSALTPKVVHNLFDLKAASNSLMHVDKFATSNLSKQGKVLSQVHDLVKSECSPHVMKKKLSEAASLSKAPRKRIKEKSPTIAVLLCGLLGWLGAHNFYAGKIVKGIVYIPFLGFIIGPALDLRKMLSGRFRDSNGLRIRCTGLSKLLAVVFLLCHLFAVYKIGVMVYETGYIGENIIINEIIEKIKGFNSNLSFTMERCEDEQLDTLEKITVSEATASSYLTSKKRTYDAPLAIDGVAQTCWQEGVEGAGEGESLTFRFNEEEHIAAISLLCGKHTSEKSFYENARPAKITVKIGTFKYSTELEDIMQRQTFRLPVAVKAEEITIAIDSVYRGSVWEDLCISEVEFYREPQGEING